MVTFPYSFRAMLKQLRNVKDQANIRQRKLLEIEIRRREGQNPQILPLAVGSGAEPPLPAQTDGPSVPAPSHGTPSSRTHAALAAKSSGSLATAAKPRATITKVHATAKASAGPAT